MRQVGLVIHPTRRVGKVIEAVDAWASAHGVAIGQIPAPGWERPLVNPVDAADCDLVLALGGDGTMLLALHAGAQASCPVLGVACGSVGVLTSVRGDRVSMALEQIVAGRWTATPVPGLEVAEHEAPGVVAINDVGVVRDGPGQIIVSVTVDEVLYARVSGDGLVVATPFGSSGYTMAAAGPIVAPGVEAIVVTPLAAHGGSCPPLIVGGGSNLALAIDQGHFGVRYEIDGRPTAIDATALTVRWRADYATLVTLAEEEPRLTGLRRRGLVLDSPRVLVRDARPHD